MAFDEDGVCRVSSTRVTLESVLSPYLRGEPPESIHNSYPTVPLADIYATIAYYLRHRDHVDEYLRQVKDAEERLIREINANPKWRALHDKMRERFASRRKPVSR